jgi:hypothetical protein
MVHVLLYSKPDCALCSELKHDLTEFQRTIAFTLVERNIEDNADDFARFHALIPVLDIEGGPLLYPPHDWYTVQQALQQAERAQVR